MKIEVVMPKMGESIQEGKILTWLKKEGDKIERDEVLLEISTDKVDTEVPSPASGIIVRLLAAVGDTVEVGKLIAEVDTDMNAVVGGSAPAPAPITAPAPAPVATPAPAPAPVAAPAPAPVAAPAPAPAVSGGTLTDVVMPKMGESIQEGKILNWVKKVGDKIERDDVLLEISTDKVDTEVPSPVAGTLAEVLFNVGDTVEVGKVIARLSSGAVVSAPVPSAPAPVTTPAPVAAPAPAPVAAVPAPVPVVAAPAAPLPANSDSKRFYSPVVRAMATEHNVGEQELATIAGTGLDGRVTKADMQGFLQNRGAAPAVVSAPVSAPAPAVASASVAAPAAAKPAAPAFLSNPDDIYKKYGRDIEIIPMDRVREKIAEHMVFSKQTSPHVTMVDEADVTGIVKLREKYKKSFEQREGIKLTFTPFFLKAAVDGVRQFPKVNVSVEGKNIIQHKKIHLGMAVALDDGNLIVPVIKDAETLNILGIARAGNDLAARARGKKLKPDEVAGGTFTVTNFGTFGALYGTPIINQPQVAIMGMGAIKKRAVVKEVDGNDIIVVRHVAHITLTFDHRVVDGALGAQCLGAIIKSLESMNENAIVL